MNVCPKCGAAIPAEAPQGLCPKCLLAQASFPTEAGPGTRHSRPLPPGRDELAQAFPHLEVIELIGQGGMGFVFKARQAKLDRFVALKILAQPLAEQASFAERFAREGRTLAKLNHPNIVTIYDFGQAGPFFYLLMEFVDGVNLRQAMRAKAMSAEQALAIVPKICDALQYAHNEGVLHRDIKPDNILLDARGRVKIADFGIAKLMAETAADHPLTGSGASLGTPHYMAPEQIERPNAVDHRADIFSLGVVFYEMLTGELPLGRFAAPSQKGNDPRLDDVVMQTLEKQPERRPQSADEVRTRVEKITQHPAEGRKETKEVSFKMGRGYITTPEFLRTWIGRRLKFSGRGEFRLDAENLTFAPRGNWIVIPLRNISGLTMGDLPGGSLKLISATFTERGEAHRILLAPGHRPLWGIEKGNEKTEEWFEAIQNAVRAKTGRTPPSSLEDFKPLPGGARSRFIAAKAIGLATIFLALISTVIFFALGSIVFYQLLHVGKRGSSHREPATATRIGGPVDSRTLEISGISRSESAIVLRSPTELFANEEIVPVIRYGQDAWTSNESVERRIGWRTKPTNGVNSTYFWFLPEPFTPGFDVMAAMERARLLAQTAPIQVTRNEVFTLFMATNGFQQTISGGLLYKRREDTEAPESTRAMFRVTSVGYAEQSEQRTVLGITFDGAIPPGTWIQTTVVDGEGKSPLFEQTMNFGKTFQMQWQSMSSTATHPLKEATLGKAYELWLNKRTEIFSLTNYTTQASPRRIGEPVANQKIESIITGYLELKRLPQRAAAP